MDTARLCGICGGPECQVLLLMMIITTSLLLLMLLLLVAVEAAIVVVVVFIIIVAVVVKYMYEVDAIKYNFMLRHFLAIGF